MLHASTRTLILKLCELTAEGAIGWRDSADATAAFETEGFVIVIDAPPTTIRILNGDNREVERVDFEDLRGSAGLSPDSDLASDAAAMAQQAARIARGAEQAIARILSALSAPPSRLLRALAAETDPSPAAPEFETLHGVIRVSRVNAAESDAALAAVAADMALSREAAGVATPEFQPAAQLPAHEEPSPPEAVQAETDMPEPAAPVEVASPADAAEPEAPDQPDAPPQPDARASAVHPQHVYRTLRERPVIQSPVRAMFGAVQSFARPQAPASDAAASARPGDGAVVANPPSSAPAPVRMLKVTAGGVVIPSGLGETHRTSVMPHRPARPVVPSSPDPYKPWS